jgi:hypothetical protein
MSDKGQQSASLTIKTVAWSLILLSAEVLHDNTVFVLLDVCPSQPKV